MFEVLDHSCNAFAQYHVGACHLKSYICRDNTEDREGVEDTQQGGHTYARRGLGLACAWAWWGHPSHRLTSSLRIFIPSESQTLKYIDIFHE